MNRDSHLDAASALPVDDGDGFLDSVAASHREAGRVHDAAELTLLALVTQSAAEGSGFLASSLLARGQFLIDGGLADLVPPLAEIASDRCAISDRLQLQLLVGRAQAMLGRLDEAQESFGAARTLSRAIRERAAECQSLVRLAEVARHRGDFLAALQLLAQAQASSIRCGPWLDGEILRVLGETLRMLGHPDAAQTLGELAAAQFKTASSPAGVASAVRGQAESARVRGHNHDAQVLAKAAISMARVAGDWEGIARSALTAGGAALQLGDLHGAVRALNLAASHYGAINSPRGLAYTTLTSASMHRMAGAADGQDMADEALRTFEALGDIHGAALAHLVLADCARVGGGWPTAYEHLDAADELAQDTHSAMLAAHVALLAGSLAQARDDAAKAEGEYAAAFRKYQACGTSWRPTVPRSGGVKDGAGFMPRVPAHLPICFPN